MNRAIGLNANDVANPAVEQEKKIKVPVSKFASLEGRLLALEGGSPASLAPAPVAAAPELTRYQLLKQNMPAGLSNDVMAEAIANLKDACTKQGLSFKAHPGRNRLFTDAAFQAEVIQKSQARYKAA